MPLKEIVFVCFAIVFSEVVVSEREEFCQTFADNDFHIDYGYQTDYWTHHFLVIGHHYWKIQWTEDKARLVSGLSKTTDLLGHQFRAVFLSKRLGYSMSGRLFRHNNTIDWMSISFNTTADQLFKRGDNNSHNNTVNTTEIGFHIDFKPSISLAVSLGTNCFVQQKRVANEEPIIFELTYHCFHFDFDTGFAKEADKQVIDYLKNKMDRKNITYGSDDQILNKFRDSRQLIAIFSQTYFTDFRYLFLFEDNKTLSYCLTSFVQLNQGCQTEPEVLISCSDYEKHLKTKDTISILSYSTIYGSNEYSIWTAFWWRHKDMVIFIIGFTLLIIITIAISKVNTKHKTQDVLKI